MQLCVTAGLATIACLLFIESPPRISKLFSKHKPVRCENISILNTTFIYGSCPDNTYTKDPGSDYPSMLATTSCTDSAGFRIDCKHGQKIFNRSNYHTFLIGDSFIQAEQLDYSKSVYGLINNSPTSPYAKAYGFGFSSWNTRQYLQAIKAINKKCSNYDIYLFANDITPRYSRSTYEEVNTESSKSKQALNSFSFKIKKFLSKSITARKILQIFKRVDASTSNSRSDYWKHHKTASFDKCPSSLVQNNIDKFSPLARDYIMYSYSYQCWDDIQKEAYDLVKADLKKIINHSNLLNSELRVIFFPPGFSFSDENTPGRLHKTYDIPDDVSLRLFGLRAKLSEDFKDSLVDVEDALYAEIDQYKKNCKRDCSNSFYFGHDGHFTKEGHAFLFRTLYSK